MAIIRQLLKPDVMMFDEPTSALDDQSKQAFIKIIRKKGATYPQSSLRDPVLISACVG